MESATNQPAQAGKWQEHSAAKNTHNRVIEMVQQHLPDLKGKKICDLPSGAGALSARLAKLGLQVTPVDLGKTEPFCYDVSKLVLADANYKLPFAEGEFDAMVSVEGIEHLENPSFFLRECARIIKPGGLLFLTTPNPDSYRSRSSVFAHGYHKYFTPVGFGSKMASHLLPIDMTFLRGAADRERQLDPLHVAIVVELDRNVVRQVMGLELPNAYVVRLKLGNRVERNRHGVPRFFQL